MLGRLGQVIYWAGCGLCVIFLALSMAALFDEEELTVVTVPIAIGSWLLGRASLYVLAGR
ncbi:hypothetical protein CHT98_20225 (plasmid) [Azospirillum brasilense]|uniref:Uncharacterized protein n=2 Tax=Azospirillum brasilense TaxID=192 RepID=A0A235HAK1_AZOBR|nr:hypothetical protein CHT98_20225 [Azospirillum brasilense]